MIYLLKTNTTDAQYDRFRLFWPRGCLPCIPFPLSGLSCPLSGFYDGAGPEGASTALEPSTGLSGASTASRIRSFGLS